MEHTYDVTVEWKRDRKGILSSSVLPTSFEVATPPEFPKGMPDIWSPEHLLVAAVNSCLMTTFLAIAENSKLSFSHFGCSAYGKLETVEGKLMISGVVLKPVVTIPSEADRERTLRILQKAEANCLISNSIKSKTEMTAEIRVEAEVAA